MEIRDESSARTPARRAARTYGADVTTPDRRLFRLARGAKRVGPSLVVAIPAVVAVALGVMFVMPAMVASGTTGQAASVWAGPVTPRSSVSAPSVQASATTPAPSPSVTVSPPVTVAPTVAATASTPAKKATTVAPVSQTVTYTPPKTTTTKAPAAKPTPAKTTAAPAPTGPLLVTVNVAGGQAQIDACKGPILWEGNLIAQHNTCGGTQFYPLKVGSLVTLTGTAVAHGTYKVTSIVDGPVGTTYTSPQPYAIQTCLSVGQARMWYLQPV